MFLMQQSESVPPRRVPRDASKAGTVPSYLQIEPYAGSASASNLKGVVFCLDADDEAYIGVSTHMHLVKNAFAVGATDYAIAETQVVPILPLTIRELSNKRFVLRHEVRVDVDREIDVYILSDDNLNVHAVGKTIESARLVWENVLIDLYLSYRDTPDDELAASGRALKDRLQETVAEAHAAD